MLESGHVRGHDLPVPALGGELFERQPAPIADLDGVRAAPSGKQPQDGRLEKRGVHAKFERQRPAQPTADSVNQVPQKGRSLLGVVHVPGPILEAQDVPGLGDVSQQRIVAAVFAMVRIEAAERPGDRRSGADHGAVDIEGEPRHVEAGQGIEHELLIELDQRPQRLLGEAPEPVAHRAGRRHARQTREAAHEGIADQIMEMFQAPGADVQQGHEQQREPRSAVVTANRRTGRVQAARELEVPHIPPQQFEAAVRRELLGHECDRQISLDHLPQGAYAQTHQRGLRELKSDVGTSALLIRGEAPLMHFNHDSIPLSFSDWG